MREAHGWSQRELVRRLANLGVDMDPATLNHIETGQHQIGLDEVLALGAALECSPLYLVFPTSRDAGVEIAPKVVVDAAVARGWVRGKEPLPGQDRDLFARVMSEEEAAVKVRWLAAYSEYTNAQGRLTAAERNKASDAAVQKLRAEVKRTLTAVREAERKLEEAS
ncbi:MAG: helix-turn-helix domain-containing protein [Actinomycetota bacterium]|nr:helix-turn-helix domain-containing protein [Actinomycetota bacterium]